MLNIFIILEIVSGGQVFHGQEPPQWRILYHMFIVFMFDRSHRLLLYERFCGNVYFIYKFTFYLERDIV